jgi:hypothetical protein
MTRAAHARSVGQQEDLQRIQGPVGGAQLPRPAFESAEDLLAARSNRAAALVVADWAWRHHEDIGAVLDMLDALGIALSDLRLRPDVITLP